MANADALIEGFRPGVMERLGLGPEVVQARNPRLVYGRMTGWGQEGPLAQAAGHDINYISVTGALAAIGTKEKPVPPLNLVGDFGGGALYLVVGVLAALLEAQKSGKGQVVDAAMCDGAASLMSMFFDMTARAAGPKGARAISSTAARISTASMNAPAAGSFRSARSSRSSTRCCASMPAFPTPTSIAQMDRKAWPALKEKLTEVFKSKTREEWCKIMEGTDICFAPILTMAEAPKHPHMAARKIFVEPPRRHPARAGAALFAHALGDQGCGEGGYCGADERVEGGEGKARPSFRACPPQRGQLLVGKTNRRSRTARRALGPGLRWLRADANRGMTDTETTPRPSASARRGGSGLPRSIRTAP